MKAGDPFAAADALIAFRNGEDGARATAGAMLIGETFNRIRIFLTAKPKG